MSPRKRRIASPRPVPPEALKRTLSLLEATFDSTADGLLVVDRAGRITAFNRKFAQLWGIPDSILAAKADQEALTYVLGQVKNPDAFLAKVRELYARPDAESSDIIEFKDGRVFERYSQPQRIAGKAVGRVWSFRDVTAQRRAEQVQHAAYRISQATLGAQSLAELLRAIHEIVATLMPARNFYVALLDEPRRQLIFPYFVDERDADSSPRPLGKGLTEYVIHSGEGLLATPEVDEDLVRRGEVELVGPSSIDWLGVPLRVRDRAIGAVVVQSYSAGVRYTDEDKALLAFVSSHVALAIERQRTGEELRDGGERYRSFIEHSTEGVWRLEIDPPCLITLPEDAQIAHFYEHARVAECNDAMARMYGRGAAREMLGARPGDLLVRSDSRNDESFRAFIRAGYRLTDAETHERDAAGRSKVFLNNYIGIIVDGHLVRIWGTQRDVTEQRRLEEQFRQAQKMEAVGQLAGGIAHDFNNILTAILGTGQLLLRDMQPADPLREDVEEIRRAALRAADLTRQLLAYSRRQILAPRVLDLNVIVSGLGPMLHRLLGADVELTTTLAPDLGPVRADPGQVEQVIVNLAVNARDAMPAGGRLSLTTENEVLDAASVQDHAGAAPGPYVVLAASDNGTGMAPEVRSHLFEPFFTTKEVGKGTGLGLATVYGIVRQSGGFISVASELGQGSTFRIHLPRVDAIVPAAEVPTPPGATVGGVETILVVEDEESVRNLARRGLEAEGYTVLTAGNAVEAVAALERFGGTIHLLVTDLVMPGMGGRELAQHLSQVRPSLRVLYISGYSNDAVANELMLQKPFTPDELARRVREVLDGGPADLALAGAEPRPSTAS